jgi:malate dehydrogenase (oxaloacetate-decarboxylating)
MTSIDDAPAALTDAEIFAAHEGGKLGLAVTAPLSDPRAPTRRALPG